MRKMKSYSSVFKQGAYFLGTEKNGGNAIGGNIVSIILLLRFAIDRYCNPCFFILFVFLCVMAIYCFVFLLDKAKIKDKSKDVIYYFRHVC